MTVGEGMAKWGVGWRWVTGRGDKSQQRAEGTDLPKTEVSAGGKGESTTFITQSFPVPTLDACRP